MWFPSADQLNPTAPDSRALTGSHSPFSRLCVDSSHACSSLSLSAHIIGVRGASSCRSTGPSHCRQGTRLQSMCRSPRGGEPAAGAGQRQTKLAGCHGRRISFSKKPSPCVCVRRLRLVCRVRACATGFVSFSWHIRRRRTKQCGPLSRPLSSLSVEARFLFSSTSRAA